MKIGFDIDDTLNNVRYKTIDLFNKKLNKRIPYKNVDAYKELTIYRCFELNNADGTELWKELMYDTYSECMPLSGAVEKLNELAAEGHEIFYLTSRKDIKDIQNITENWLIKHGFPFKKENFYIGLVDNQKAVLAKKLEINLFFEDKPAVIESLIENKVNFIIKDQAYNRMYKEKRVTHWSFLNTKELFI